MRIAFVCYWDARRPDGVTQKVASQLAQWRSHGHEAELFLLGPRAGADSEIVLAGRTFTFAGPLDRVRQTRALYAAAGAFRPDVAYIRYDLFLPPPLALSRRLPTVIEVNSDFRAELAARHPAAALYGRLQEPLVERAAAAAICVTYELAERLRRRAPALPIRVISNGIAFDGVSSAAPAAGPVRVLYIGDDVYWQGVDKIFELAAALPAWRFDLVGVDRARSAANVVCHGFLPPPECEPLLAGADVGLGTLALHRKHMNEACALKVRRYLARGLPVIIGHRDTDFLAAEPWFLLRLPNDEANVRTGTERIRRFVESVRGRRVAREEVQPLLDVAVKERERLDYLEEIVAGWAARGRVAQGSRWRPFVVPGRPGHPHDRSPPPAESLPAPESSTRRETHEADGRGD